MAETWTWDKLVEQFRALGGIADNVCLKDGSLGRGVFPVDQAKPIHIHAPKNVLVPVDQIDFENGAIRVKKGASEIGKREKEFFEAYERDFSWGAGGRDDCKAFVESVDQLPAGLRDILTNEYGLGALFRGTQEDRVQKRFIRSRMIRSQGAQVIMPIVDLINHNSSLPGYDAKSGVTVKGTFPHEVLVRYNISDPFAVFSTWGFASAEPIAYSMSMRVPVGQRRLIIHRNSADKAKIGNFNGPTVKIDGNNIVLSHLMLGHAKFPKLSKGFFYRLMKDQGVERAAAEEIFDRVQHFNRMRFLKLMPMLDGLQGIAAVTLRNVVQYQLTAQSYYIGSREI